MRADAQGNKLWDKVYRGEIQGWSRLSSIIAVDDGGFLLGGWSDSNAGGDKSEDSRGGADFWVVRIDAQGEKLWDKTYGGNLNERLYLMVEADDGGFLLGGRSESGAGFDKTDDQLGGDDFWIVRIDAQGARLWDKTYGGNFNDELHAIVSVPDGGFLLGGWSDSFTGFDKSEDGRGQADYWLLRLGPGGEKIWDKTYGGNGRDVLKTMVPASDGGFLLGGWSTSDAGFEKSEDARGEADCWLVRVNARGAKLWDKTYGGTDSEWLFSITSAPGDGYLLGGPSSSDAGFEKSEDALGALGRNDYWIARINAQGEKLWDKTYGGANTDKLNAIVVASDGGFLLGGSSWSDSTYDKSDENLGNSDYWIVKIYDQTSVSGLRFAAPEILAAPGHAALELYGSPFNQNSSITLFRDRRIITPVRYRMLA